MTDDNQTPEKTPDKTPAELLREKRLANLRPRPPWKPGESGNPNGRPPGARSRTTMVKEALESPDPEFAGGTIADRLIWKQVIKADEGDTAAFNTLMDSGYGKLKDKTELTGLNDGPLQITRRVVKGAAPEPTPSSEPDKD